MRIEIRMTIGEVTAEAAVEDQRDPDGQETQAEFEARLLRLLDKARKQATPDRNATPSRIGG